ncbi:uncharacterized protein BO80DRAFT_446741 [Aspergillus ibericus CBS 121593]|uniref:Uncharacterized protein n=1 Tax=Aspergillus ibericus CBS 121593 TaxID=1448316 RepID=A0A395GUM6_9EURO|nr:hypothetical protein BO80DRAFT_446741 [Aspergillus ibericus CBS 121593]RAK99176.1 hypothetical protein BO80DRAFT_446741 [Aspergillus ibericus CBS 121593]
MPQSILHTRRPNNANERLGLDPEAEDLCELRLARHAAGEAKRRATAKPPESPRATQPSRQLFSTWTHVEPHGSRLDRRQERRHLEESWNGGRAGDASKKAANERHPREKYEPSAMPSGSATRESSCLSAPPFIPLASGCYVAKVL